MNVDVLQMHLTNLSQLFRFGGGKGTANDLDEVCQMLQPFRDRKVKDLLASIAKADEILRSGPTKSTRKKPTADVGPISARIVDLYQRAGSPAVAREEILTAFTDLESLSPKVDQLRSIAKQIGITEKLNKVPLLNKMRKAVLDRKDIGERVHA